MPKRQGNNPKREIAPRDTIAPETLRQYAEQAQYTGSPHHKRNPTLYGFDRMPGNRHPAKSLCDGSRTVELNEARELLRQGIAHGMVSVYPKEGLPKYVWAVDSKGHVYEAKRDINGDSLQYHGYELGADDADMREWVIKEWNLRCTTN